MLASSLRGFKASGGDRARWGLSLVDLATASAVRESGITHACKRARLLGQLGVLPHVAVRKGSHTTCHSR